MADIVVLFMATPVGRARDWPSPRMSGASCPTDVRHRSQDLPH